MVVMAETTLESGIPSESSTWVSVVISRELLWDARIACDILIHCATVSAHIKFFKKDLFLFERQAHSRRRDREQEKDLPTTDSLPKQAAASRSQLI